MRSLQARMFLVFALIATVPLLAMSYLALNATQEALREEVGRANGDAAKAAAGFVDVYVENARSLLEAEARSPALREALAADDRAGQLLVVQGLRERASYEGTRIFRGIALYDAEGALLVVWPADTAEPMGDALHAAAVDLARTEQRTVMFPVPRAGEAVLPVATPVVLNGTLRGVLVGDVSLRGLAAGLDPFAAGARTIFVTDGQGRLLVGAILLASVAIARRIVAPVRELTEASRALAEGKLGRRIQPSGDDEIGELARAFNQMADRIAESLEGIRRSESRYRSLVESASDLIFTIQPDGVLSFASPQMRRVLGDAVRPGAPAGELVEPADRAAFQAAVERVLARGEPALWVPFQLRAQGQAPRAVVTNFTPIYDGGERPARVLAVAHDVTEERRNEALRERAFQMARLVSEEAGLEALAQRGLAVMLATGPLARGAVYLARKGELREAARQDVADAAPLDALAARAWQEGEPARADVGGEAALAVPLVEHGEVLGAVVLAGEARVLDAERDVLAALASQLAVGLRRSLFEARLKEHAAELETRVAERTRELTQKSEEMEQFLYSVSHDLKAPLISIQG
ncbi:MAG TPA: HAMP domain-containing protein, partial [Candidatus Thermoplasmatota archaeon]|nr:HAMP domain-containing protein [Candidatus Thermoplasmatota archaeon]